MDRSAEALSAPADAEARLGWLFRLLPALGFSGVGVVLTDWDGRPVARFGEPAGAGAAEFPLAAGDGGRLGLLTVAAMRGGAALSESDRALLAETAAHAAWHVERAFAADAEAREERWTRDLVEFAKRDWEQTFDAIRDGILLLDGEGRVLRVNRAARERIGAEYRGIVGRRVEELLGPAGAAAIREALAAAEEADRVIALPDLKGIFEIAAWPRVEGGGAVVVLSDATEKERLREQLIHSEKLSALGELISGIAHELNNPLTAVLGYAQILALKDEGRFGRELAHLKEESLRASRIVRNLLTFARRRESAREPEDLNDLIQKTVALREYDLRVRNIAIEYQLAPLPRSMMDRTQLQQVVLNLVNNAEYAIHAARESGRIRIATSVHGDRIRLVVEDDGPGVPPELRGRIFNPFFTTKPVGKGTGLGLPICFGILKDHGGEIRLDPDYSKGARFVLEMPVAPWVPAPAKSEGPTRPPAPLKILIIDDEEPIRHLGREFLSGRGHEVALADNAAAALALLDDRAFDAVVCDLRMPGIDGLSLHRQVAERWPALGDRFLFVSGDVESLDPAAPPPGPVVQKPFDLEELARSVEAIGRRRDRD